MISSNDGLISGDTFARLKAGDRYFFTHLNQAGSFTAKQRKKIILRRLSDVICDNTEIQQLQGNAFLKVINQMW